MTGASSERRVNEHDEVGGVASIVLWLLAHLCAGVAALSRKRPVRRRWATRLALGLFVVSAVGAVIA
jgi:hypothetical protein